MEDAKPIPYPLQSRVKFDATCTTPEVDATLYHQLVGILLYMTHTHLDISFFIGLVSHYMKTLLEIHWKEAKKIP
jgi:hypothetical protein